MEKRLSVEGSPASRMVQLIRKFGHNRELSVEIGEVVTPLPALSIRLQADGLLLDRGDIIIAEHLTEHTREVKSTGSGAVLYSITLGSVLKAGDKVIVIGDDDTQFYYVIDKAVV